MLSPPWSLECLWGLESPALTNWRCYCWVAVLGRFSMCRVARVSRSGRASQSDAVTAGHQSIWVTWLSWSWTDQLWNLVDVGLDLSDVNFLQAVTVRHGIYVRLSWKITGKCQPGMSPNFAEDWGWLRVLQSPWLAEQRPLQQRRAERLDKDQWWVGHPINNDGHDDIFGLYKLFVSLVSRIWRRGSRTSFLAHFSWLEGDSNWHHWSFLMVKLMFFQEDGDHRCPFPTGWLINRGVSLPL